MRRTQVLVDISITDHNILRTLIQRQRERQRREFAELCLRYDNRCLACGRKDKLTRDHVDPSGSGKIENIQPLCRRCNSRKFTKVIDYRDSPHPACDGAPLPLVSEAVLLTHGERVQVCKLT